MVKHTNAWLERAVKGWGKLGFRFGPFDFAGRGQTKLGTLQVLIGWNCFCGGCFITSCQSRQWQLIWNKVSNLLSECGVMNKISSKQTLKGCKVRMNFNLFKIWHTIRAYILDAIWQARNSRVHNGHMWIIAFSRGYVWKMPRWLANHKGSASKKSCY